MRFRIFSFLLASGLFSVPTFSFEMTLHSPTAVDFPATPTALRRYVQPASSGKPESGMFGLTRNEGTRFHEGIDVKSVVRDRRGNAVDAIFAVFPGKVAHVCRENNGSYGKYVVLEHRSGGISFYSLYAHLSLAAASLKEGESVPAGTFLGVMGSSSSVYDFPAGTEHLHFEIGLRLGEKSFLKWYERSFPPGDENLHDCWNGLNLAGTDPVRFFSEAPLCGNFRDYLDRVPVALAVVVKDADVPEILKFSPGLSRADIPEKTSSWRISFSWSGTPLEFFPMEIYEKDDSERAKIVFVSEKYIRNLLVMKMAEKRADDAFSLGSRMKNILSVIFGEEF